MVTTERKVKLFAGSFVIAAGAIACSSSSTEAPPPQPSITASSHGTEFPPGTLVCNPNSVTKADREQPVVFTCPSNIKVDTDPGPTGAEIAVSNGRKRVPEGVVDWNTGTAVSFPVPGSHREVFVSTAGGGIDVRLSRGHK
ncbi:MAG TPA: hypothetical protein VLF93_03830 [Candidatus Saccharimonadales bacterium]|nr:hypothetical protein [Candidatus Saccharimonadales bacterium]